MHTAGSTEDEAAAPRTTGHGSAGDRTREDPPGALAGLLAAAARGRFPAADGGLTVLPQPSPHDAGVIAFTAHHVVFADADPSWIRSLLPEGDLSAPLNPPFLAALCARLGRNVNNIDVLTVAQPLQGPPPLRLRPFDAAAAGHREHERVQRALRHRGEVLGWSAPGGVVLLGRGVAGRWEVAIEVDEDARGRGLGRALATAARHLVPDGAPLWAQIAPGNAASVRAFLEAGFAPVGAEALLFTGYC